MQTNEFYDSIMNVIKDEISLTGTYDGKLFGLVEKDGEFAISKIDVPNKNLDDDFGTIISIMKTKTIIDTFPQELRSDGFEIIAFAHTEILFTEKTKKLVFIKITVDEDGYNVVDEHKVYDIDSNTAINNDGELVYTKPKLVELKKYN
jgi:hypothetical protein